MLICYSLFIYKSFNIDDINFLQVVIMFIYKSFNLDNVNLLQVVCLQDSCVVQKKNVLMVSQQFDVKIYHEKWPS